MGLIMETLRQHMDENEDLVLLFVRKKGDEKENNKQKQEEKEEEEEDELRTVPNSELIPNLPEGISIRGRPNMRPPTRMVTSCYGECRDIIGEEAMTDNDTSREEGTTGEEGGRDNSYFTDDESDQDSAGEDLLSSSEDEDDNEEEETEEDFGIERSAGTSRFNRGGDRSRGNMYGGITVRQPVSSPIVVQQQDVSITREEDEEESASDESVISVSDSEYERVADTTASDGEVELAETDGYVEVNPLGSTEDGSEDQPEENSGSNSSEGFLVTIIRGITVTRRQEDNDERPNLHPGVPSQPIINQHRSRNDESSEGIALDPLDRERPAPTNRQQAETNPSNHRVIERLARMGITVTRRPHFHHPQHHQRIRIQDHQDTDDQSGSDSDVETDDEMPVLIRDLDLMEREE